MRAVFLTVLLVVAFAAQCHGKGKPGRKLEGSPCDLRQFCQRATPVLALRAMEALLDKLPKAITRTFNTAFNTCWPRVLFKGTPQANPRRISPEDLLRRLCSEGLPLALVQTELENCIQGLNVSPDLWLDTFEVIINQPLRQLPKHLSCPSCL